MSFLHLMYIPIVFSNPFLPLFLILLCRCCDIFAKIVIAHPDMISNCVLVILSLEHSGFQASFHAINS